MKTDYYRTPKYIRGLMFANPEFASKHRKIEQIFERARIRREKKFVSLRIDHLSYFRSEICRLQSLIANSVNLMFVSNNLSKIAELRKEHDDLWTRLTDAHEHVERSYRFRKEVLIDRLITRYENGKRLAWTVYWYL